MEDGDVKRFYVYYQINEVWHRYWHEPVDEEGARLFATGAKVWCRNVYEKETDVRIIFWPKDRKLPPPPRLTAEVVADLNKLPKEFGKR